MTTLPPDPASATKLTRAQERVLGFIADNGKPPKKCARATLRTLSADELGLITYPYGFKLTEAGRRALGR